MIGLIKSHDKSFDYSVQDISLVITVVCSMYFVA